MQLRAEARANTRDFDDRIDDDNDDAWLLTRLRLGLTVQPTLWLKLYAQTQDVRELDSDRPNTPGVRGTEGGDEFDLRQAWIALGDLSRFPFALTFGRQRLHYGDRRLLGDPTWNNTGRTFDAVKLRWQGRDGWIDAFAARPVQIREDVFNDSDAADHLFGLYGTMTLLPFQTTELYLLHRDKADAQPDLDPTNRFDPNGSWNGPAQRITTLGTGWQSTPGGLGPWDYTVELAGQWGEACTDDRTTAPLPHRAFAAGFAAGYTFASLGWQPRLALGYDYASGDRDPADACSESFLNLFPSNHEPYGLLDVFAWRNVHDASAQLTAMPAKNVEIGLHWHVSWLAQTSDYWFRSNGITPLRTTTPAGSDVRAIDSGRFAGHELDVTVEWSAAQWLRVLVGYSHFFSGAYLRNTGPADDAHFAYAQLQVRF